MSLAVALNRPDLMSGVLLMSGGVLPQFVPKDAPPQLQQLPFLAQHGLYDGVLPVTLGREVKALLERLGAPVDYREYPMAHEVSMDSLSRRLRVAESGARDRPLALPRGVPPKRLACFAAVHVLVRGLHEGRHGSTVAADGRDPVAERGGMTGQVGRVVEPRLRRRARMAQARSRPGSTSTNSSPPIRPTLPSSPIIRSRMRTRL